MFFRFCAALLLVVLVSMAGVTLEKRTLELRRAVSLQHFHTDLLVEQHVKLRLETQRLTAPSQLSELPPDRNEQSASARPADTRAAGRKGSPGDRTTLKEARNPDDRLPAPSSLRLPLLRFQQPFSPEGIE